MPRSLKKGPFVSYKLEKKIKVMDEASKKKIIKTIYWKQIVYFGI